MSYASVHTPFDFITYLAFLFAFYSPCDHQLLLLYSCTTACYQFAPILAPIFSQLLEKKHTFVLRQCQVHGKRAGRLVTKNFTLCNSVAPIAQHSTVRASGAS